MPDLDTLRDLPELRPLPGQVEDALVQVRVRRRRSAFVTLTSGAAAIAATAILLTHPAGTQSLQPASPTVATTATAAPVLTGQSGEAGRVPGPRFATSSPTAVVSVPPAVTSSPTPQPPDEDGRPPIVRYDYNSTTNPGRLRDGMHYKQGCGPETGPSTCWGGIPRDEGAAGVTLTINTCVGPATTETLHFPTAQEGDVVVRDDSGKAVWHSSLGVRYAATPHDRVLLDYDCSEWSVLWDRTNDAGKPVPKARYTAFFTVTSTTPHTIKEYVTVS